MSMFHTVLAQFYHVFQALIYFFDISTWLVSHYHAAPSPSSVCLLKASSVSNVCEVGI